MLFFSDIIATSEANMKLTKEFIINLSKQKKEPKWMLDFRLQSFAKFLELDNPDFGPEINLDFAAINYYKKTRQK